MFRKVFGHPVFRASQMSIKLQSTAPVTEVKNIPNYETLSVTIPKPFVYHVEINRPKKLNSFNYEMFHDLSNCFETLNSDEDCRVVLLSGVGRMFSAGLDLSTVTVIGEAAGAHEDVARKCKAYRTLVEIGQKGASSPEKCVKPVIALIHNGCIGLGTNFISSVDIRYCSEDAYFQVKEVDLGLAADMGALQRLPKIIGSASLVNELCFTGRKFPAKEALEQGLVSKVFKDKESMVAAGLELADSLAKKSPVAVQMIKRNLLYSRDHSVEEGLRHILDWNMIMLQSEDFIKAAMALATKSPPPDFDKL